MMLDFGGFFLDVGWVFDLNLNTSDHVIHGVHGAIAFYHIKPGKEG